MKLTISNFAAEQAFSRQFGTGACPSPGAFRASKTINHQPSTINSPGFSLVELLIVMALLSLIVLALMDVFSSTQRAFRASATQSDVLEGSRAAMELITADLRGMTPANGNTSFLVRDVNFSAVANGFSYNSPTYTSPSYIPLTQTLPGGTSGNRVNLLNYFFILGQDKNNWVGTGYVVDTTSTTLLYPLYRFRQEISNTNAPHILFANFLAEISNDQFTNMSHLVDGVVHLVVRAYDPNGVWLTNGYSIAMTPPQDVFTYGDYNGEVNLDFAGNAVPAAVELQMGVLEDRVLARAQSLPNVGAPNDPRTQFLENQSGSVHIFRQTVNIENVDRTAYQ